MYISIVIRPNRARIQTVIKLSFIDSARGNFEPFRQNLFQRKQLIRIIVYQIYQTFENFIYLILDLTANVHHIKHLFI